MSPGIFEDFGAVQSSTTPSGESAEGATPGSAEGTRFDDLVEAWLAPAAGDDDPSEAAADAADTAVLSLPATLPRPFPVPLPLPLPGPVRVPESVSADASARATEPVPQDQPLVTGPAATSASPLATTAAIDAVPGDGGASIDTDLPASETPFASEALAPAPRAGDATDAPRVATTATEQPRADRSETFAARTLVDTPREAGSPGNRRAFAEVPAQGTTPAAIVREERPEDPNGAAYTAETPAAEETIPQAPESSVTGERTRPASVGDAVVATARNPQAESHDTADSATSIAQAVPPAPQKAPGTSISDPAGELRAEPKMPVPAQPSADGGSRAATPAEEREWQPTAHLSSLPLAPRADAKVNAPAALALQIATAADVLPAAKDAAGPVENVSTSRLPASIELPAVSVEPGANDHDGHDERRPARDERSHESLERPVTDRTAIASALPIADRTDTPEAPASPATPSRSSAVTLLHGAAPASIQQTPLAVPVAAPDASAPAATPAPDTADRIVQSLKFQVARGGGDAVLHLQPEHLGPVAIALRVENGVVSAVITADHPAVAEWLQSNQQSLREGLEASGLQLERFIVQRDGQSPSDRQRREWLDARRRDYRRRTPKADSTFEISM